LEKGNRFAELLEKMVTQGPQEHGIGKAMGDSHIG